MAELSPRERRMKEAVSLEPTGPADYQPETPEELQARQENNLREWHLAYQAAKTPKQREVLLNELDTRRGIDFPGTARPATGFNPVELSASDASRVEGFAPVTIPGPVFSDSVKEWAERSQPAPDLSAGTRVGRTPAIGFQDTPGGAAVSLRMPRVAGDAPEETGGGPAARIAAETIGSFAGGTIGGAVGGLTRSPAAAAIGMRAGEAGGAFLGSLFSEAFDPTTDPLQTASEAAAWTAATGAVASGTAHVFRRMIGKPTEAGKTILKIMEREGKVPPPGAVLPETSIAQSFQSIGSAEAFFGKSVKEHIQETGLAITKELRHYVADFYRYKKGADRLFREWDTTVASLGSPRLVAVNASHFDALEAAVKEWDRLGLTHTGQVDKTLLGVVRNVQELRAAGLDVKTVKLTMEEAEAARTFIYNRARAMAGSAPAEKGAIAGQDFARAYREIAEDIGVQMDGAIDKAVKDGKISVEARGKLVAARQLWRQWKQGEAILDELAVPLKAAGRREGPLKAQRIETALVNIERMEEKFGRPVVSSTQKAHLASLQRALKAVEESGKSSAFTLAVRTGQMASLTINIGQGIAQAVGMALSPAAFTFLVTNPKAASLLIRGLRLDPGSAAAARVGRELMTLMAREGFAPPEREGEEPVVE